VAESLSTWFEKESEILTEASVAHVLPASMGAGNIVVLGNSLPVRNADRFAAPADTNSRTILNRGASGIDGTIAVGAGVAAGASNRVIVMLGDQALLHDLNSLALADQAGMIVIVVNNYGGRIFHRLPISRQEDIFERFFVHSHEYTFEYAAAQFGIRYEVPGSTLAFRQAMQNSLAADGASLIEIQVDFEENEIRRQKLHEYISKKFPAGPGESGHDSTAHSDSP